jgi:hypothetical protein
MSRAGEGARRRDKSRGILFRGPDHAREPCLEMRRVLRYRCNIPPVTASANESSQLHNKMQYEIATRPLPPLRHLASNGGRKDTWNPL